MSHAEWHIESMTLALDGVLPGDLDTEGVALMGVKPVLDVTVIDLPQVGAGGGGKPRDRERQGPIYLVRYKGQMVRYDPAKDKEKKLVRIEAYVGGVSFKELMLVDAKKLPLVFQITNWVNRTAREVNVRVSDLRERSRKISVALKNIRRPKDWWRS